MKIEDYILLGIVLICVINAIVFIGRQMKQGNPMCCSNCGHCMAKSDCTKNNIHKDSHK